MGNFTNLPAALAATLQQGFLEREFEEGLDSTLGYAREALEETVPARIGETLTRTRTGRKAPVTTPYNPTNNTGLDNGLTPSDATMEQYSFTLQGYADTSDVNLMDDLATIANNVFRVARNNGVQAAQSIDRIARKKLFNAYLGGNTRVRTDLGAGGTTTCHVNDIRGFTTVLVNGVPTGISSGNPLTVTEVSVSNGVNQTLTVTAATADVSNASDTPDGISGVLTFNTATTPVNGDCLLANNSPQILRPFGKITTAQLVGSDLLTLGLVQDAATYLGNNGVPPMDDGSYHCVLDRTSIRQLFADQDFKILYAGRYQSEEYKEGDIIRLLGLTFIPTTETYVQLSGGAATGAAAIQTRVRRPIVLGAESMIRGNFEGLEKWLDRQNVNAFSDVALVDSVAHITRPPLDRLQQFLSLSWNWIGDVAVPTDLTATTTIIPTASSALYKRAIAIETAG